MNATHQPGTTAFRHIYNIHPDNSRLLRLRTYFWCEPNPPRLGSKTLPRLEMARLTIGIWYTDKTYGGTELIERILKGEIKDMSGKAAWLVVRPVTLTEMLDFERRFPRDVKSLVPDHSSSNNIFAPQKDQLVIRCDNLGTRRIYLADSQEVIQEGNPVMVVLERQVKK